MTDTTPATAPDPAALPLPCCLPGSIHLSAVEDSFDVHDQFKVMAAVENWTAHQIWDHGNQGTPVPGCSNCREWEVQGLVPPLDLMAGPLQAEAARHFAAHQVMDPLRVRWERARVAG